VVIGVQAATVTKNRYARTKKQRILELSFVAFLLGAGFLLRVWGMSKLHFWDEAVYLQDAEVICCGKVNYSELGSRPPLLSLYFAAVFLVWHHVYAACIATALLNALGPVFLYYSGRMLAVRAAAVLASLLLAFLPYFVGAFPAGFVSDDTGNSLLSDSPAHDTPLTGKAWVARINGEAGGQTLQKALSGHIGWSQGIG
jgi:hypothetical protein